MHAAVRPYVTTGIALVGASVIAVTPVAPPTPPDLPVANTAVQLTAVESAAAFYPLVVRATLENAGIMVQRYLAEPIPIIQAILGNEVTAPMDIPTALSRVGYSAVSWAVAGALGALHSNGDIVNAVATLNPIDLVNAVLNVPGRIADSVINGYTISLLQVDVEGLLGLAGSLIALNQAIGAAISELLGSPLTPLLGVNEPPQLGAMALTLATGPAVDSGSTPTDVGLAMTGPDGSIEAQDGLDTADTADATNKLSQADSNAAGEAQQSLMTSAKVAGEADEAAEPASDPSVTGAANATDGLAHARSNTSTEGQHGLDIATSAINNAGTDIRDGNKAQPAQANGDSAPSGGDAGKPAESVGDQPGSTGSEPGSDTKEAETSTATG